MTLPPHRPMTLKPWLLLTSLSLSLTLAPAALSAFPTPDLINPYPTYIYPAQGMLTSGYGWRWGRLHKGIDIAAAVGTPILAAAPGTVSFAGWHQGGYGNLVELQHPDGSMTRYAHNSRLLVKVGERVEQGQAIAQMGSTGYSTGSHCHFELHLPGQGAVNPIALLPSVPNQHVTSRTTR